MVVQRRQPEGDDEAGAKGDTGQGSVNAADLSGLREQEQRAQRRREGRATAEDL